MSSFFEHTRKPRGLGGKLMVTLMNAGHRPLARWGLSHLQLADHSTVLDVGCGGGANLAAMRKTFYGGEVVGVDYSAVSVARAKRVNRAAIAAGQCRVLEANVATLPFPSASFHQVTAFETVYFWPDLVDTFREIRRVLHPGGGFLLCNEADGTDPAQERWCQTIGGMRIYTGAQLTAMLHEAGFQEIHIDRHPRRHWLCITARNTLDASYIP